MKFNNQKSLSDILDQAIEDSNKYYKSVCEELSPEERNMIIERLEDKSCNTCVNPSCRVETSEKSGLNELGEPVGHNCVGWYNPEYIGKSKVLGIYNIYKLK